MSEDVQIFKAQDGIISNKLTPVIRKVDTTTIKLTPLDIPINDYLADIFEEREEPQSHRNLEQSNSHNNLEEKDGQNEYNDNYPSKPSPQPKL